jgi:hypothetical protein
MKVAIITAMMNHERTVNAECMKCAIRFMEWQVELKKVFQPGEAVNDAAKLREIILEAMRVKCLPGGYLNIIKLAHDRKWAGRFGDWMVKSVIQNLVEMKELVPKMEPVKDKDGDIIEAKESKTMFGLRNWEAGEKTQKGNPLPPEKGNNQQLTGKS